MVPKIKTAPSVTTPIGTEQGLNKPTHKGNKMNTKQQHNDILSGEMVEQFADFFDRDAIRLPSYTLRRWTSGERRVYFEITREGEVQFYHGITSVLKAQMPTPYALIEWIAKNGVEGGREIRDEAAAYGTAMHVIFAMYLKMGEVDFDEAPGYVPDWRDSWRSDLQSDLLAFVAFCQAHNVRPLAIEALLRSERLKVACTVDLVCRMNIGSGVNGSILKKDGAGEEVVALIDFKSGKKGFYESHAAQAVACLDIYNENGIGPRATRAFNWAPKDWTGSAPTWTLKDQTDFPLAKVENWLDNHSIDNGPDFAPKPIRVYDGHISSDMDPASAFRDIDVAALIRKRYGLEAAPSVTVEQEEVFA